jgi:hypothetical protein
MHLPVNLSRCYQSTLLLSVDVEVRRDRHPNLKSLRSFAGKPLFQETCAHVGACEFSLDG